MGGCRRGLPRVGLAAEASLTRRDSVGRRIGWAALAFLGGWGATGLVWIAFTRPWIPTPTLGTSWGDTLAILLFEAGFAAIGWFLVVLPIVRFGDHDGWFFRPALAPLIGAACGVAILLAEMAVFFQVPPWAAIDDTGDESLRLFIVLAGVFGGVLWWMYARAMRRPAPPASTSG